MKITVIGLGLIGGSIAKALNVYKGENIVVGCDVDEYALKKAKDAGWIDCFYVEPERAVDGADLVVLCTPICSMVELANKISPFMKKGSILTDVGSVKGFLQKEFNLPEGITYIGAHPMAGSEKSGLSASDANLFVGRPFVIIPPDDVEQEKIDIVVNFAKSLRAIAVQMNAREHDLATAMVSHMPHVLSSALMLTAVNDESTNNAKYLAAGCFRDMTRVSGANVRMWTDICLTNPCAIVEQLEKVEQLLLQAKQKIKEGDKVWLEKFFTEGRAGRERFGMFVTDEKGE